VEATVIIELKGHIGKDGKFSLETQKPLPPGNVDVVIAYTDRDRSWMGRTIRCDPNFRIRQTDWGGTVKLPQWANWPVWSKSRSRAFRALFRDLPDDVKHQT